MMNIYEKRRQPESRKLEFKQKIPARMFRGKNSSSEFCRAATNIG